MVPAIPVPFLFRSAFGELTKLVNATGVGPDIESMFDTTEEVVLRERWLASAISLGAGKWAVVNTEEDSVQIGGGKVSIRIFEGGSLQGSGHLRDRSSFTSLSVNEITISALSLLRVVIVTRLGDSLRE